MEKSKLEISLSYFAEIVLWQQHNIYIRSCQR